MSQQFQHVSYVNLLNSFQAMNSGLMHQAQTAFTQVRDSRENLFASNLMPLPPKFSFQERTGRINWRALMNTDLDKISKEVDLKSLESLLQNITFAQLDRDDLERLGDAHFIKLFRLSQYSIEYLLYTQNYMESLCKTLDIEYKQTYEKTVKTEEAIKKYQQELKLMRKELKLKQKTLSTYEYLMKLPVEQEQDVIKCKHCVQKPKFFLNKQYLQKHYQRNHPEIDFHREFNDMNANNQNVDYGNSINERQLQNTLEKQQQQTKIDQEQLFDKIKKELFISLTDNFKNLEKELTVLKEKANYQQIQNLLETYESKNEQEQRKIQESLNKPAKMLEELKHKWGEMFQQQSSTMKDMIAASVNDALSKRKEDRDKKKNNLSKNSDQSQQPSEVSQIQEQKVKFFEQRINEFDEKFKENEKIKLALEQKVKEYERKLQEKAQTEKELQIKLQEEEQKRQEEEKLRKIKEQELIEQINAKAKEELKLKLLEEQNLREQKEQKLKEEQQKIKENEEKKKKEQEEAQLKLQQEKEQKEKKLKDQELQKIQQQKQEEEKQQKLKEEQEKQRKEQEEAEKLKKQKEEEEKNKKIQEDNSDVEEIIEEQEESEPDNNDDQEEQKELVKDNKPTQNVQEKNTEERIKEKIIQKFKQEFAKDNIYEGHHAHIKSIFPHSHEEIEAKKSEVQVENIMAQEQLLEQEFSSQKISVVSEKSNPLSTTRKEDLKNVNEMLKGINRKDAEKINNSLLKRLNDQNIAPYAALIDGFLNKALKAQ